MIVICYKTLTEIKSCDDKRNIPVANGECLRIKKEIAFSYPKFENKCKQSNS